MAAPSTVTLTLDVYDPLATPLRTAMDVVCARLRRVDPKTHASPVIEPIGSQSVVGFDDITVDLDENGHAEVDLIPGTYSIAYENGKKDSKLRTTAPVCFTLDASATIGELLAREMTLSTDRTYFATKATSTFAASDFTSHTTHAIINFPEIASDSYVAFAVRADGLDIMRIGEIGQPDMLADFSRVADLITIDSVEYKYWVSDDEVTSESLSEKTWTVFKTKSVV